MEYLGYINEVTLLEDKVSEEYMTPEVGRYETSNGRMILDGEEVTSPQDLAAGHVIQLVHAPLNKDETNLIYLTLASVIVAGFAVVGESEKGLVYAGASAFTGIEPWRLPTQHSWVPSGTASLHISTSLDSFQTIDLPDIAFDTDFADSTILTVIDPHRGKLYLLESEAFLHVGTITGLDNPTSVSYTFDYTTGKRITVISCTDKVILLNEVYEPLEEIDYVGVHLVSYKSAYLFAMVAGSEIKSVSVDSTSAVITTQTATSKILEIIESNEIVYALHSGGITNLTTMAYSSFGFNDAIDFCIADEGYVWVSRVNAFGTCYVNRVSLVGVTTSITLLEDPTYPTVFGDAEGFWYSLQSTKGLVGSEVAELGFYPMEIGKFEDTNVLVNLYSDIPERTMVSDTTPDDKVLAEVISLDTATNVKTMSDIITLEGFNVPLPVIVDVQGTKATVYNTDNNTTSSLTDGQEFTIEMNSFLSEDSGIKTAHVYIGQKHYEFDFIPNGPDIYPDPFSWGSITMGLVSERIGSKEEVTISGLGEDDFGEDLNVDFKVPPNVIPVVNGVEMFEDFSEEETSVLVTNGDVVSLIGLPPAPYGTNIGYEIYIGGRSARFFLGSISLGGCIPEEDAKYNIPSNTWVEDIEANHNIESNSWLQDSEELATPIKTSFSINNEDIIMVGERSATSYVNTDLLYNGLLTSSNFSTQTVAGKTVQGVQETGDYSIPIELNATPLVNSLTLQDLGIITVVENDLRNMSLKYEGELEPLPLVTIPRNITPEDKDELRPTTFDGTRQLVTFVPSFDLFNFTSVTYHATITTADIIVPKGVWGATNQNTIGEHVTSVIVDDETLMHKADMDFFVDDETLMHKADMVIVLDDAETTWNMKPITYDFEDDHIIALKSTTFEHNDGTWSMKAIVQERETVSWPFSFQASMHDVYSYKQFESVYMSKTQWGRFAVPFQARNAISNILLKQVVGVTQDMPFTTSNLAGATSVSYDKPTVSMARMVVRTKVFTTAKKHEYYQATYSTTCEVGISFESLDVSKDGLVAMAESTHRDIGAFDYNGVPGLFSTPELAISAGIDDGYDEAIVYAKEIVGQGWFWYTRDVRDNFCEDTNIAGWIKGG